MARRAPPGHRPCYFVTHGGLRLLAAERDVPPMRYAEHGGLAVETSARGRGGNRLRNLRRNFEHTLGINACMARLAADAHRAGHPAPTWWSEAEASQRFRFDGATRWVRPDAAGIYYQGQTPRPFLFEYDRGTMRRRDYMRKLVGLVAFFESGLAEETYGDDVVLLVVSETARGEQRFAAAVNDAQQRAGILLPALLTTTELVGGNGLGLLGRIWAEPHRGGRRSWFEWTLTRR